MNIDVSAVNVDVALEQLHRDGWVVIEGVLSDAELVEVQEALLDHYPRVDEFDPTGAHASLAADMWGGLVWFPFANQVLNRLPVHAAVEQIATRFLGTSDVMLSRAAIQAKYAGAGTDFEQVMHFDFGNHTLVVPRQDVGFAQFGAFLYLEDVTVELGATRVVPKTVARYDPHAAPNDYIAFTHRSRAKAGDLYEAEVPAVGPAGSLFAFTPDVLHRAAPLTSPNGRRVSVSLAYSTRGSPWLGYTAWPRLAEEHAFTAFLAQATPRQRQLFGFPAPGDAYWTNETITGVSARYPNMDMTPYVPTP